MHSRNEREPIVVQRYVMNAEYTDQQVDLFGRNRKDEKRNAIFDQSKE